jgi:membrane protein implicated in regulation of membrane protease activity
MRLIRTVVREVFGLFVDDVSFASLIIIWMGLVKILSSRTASANRWYGIILFLGLALILIESAVRFSRKHNARHG